MTELQRLLRSLIKVQEESGARAAARDTRVLADLAADDKFVERVESLDLVEYFDTELVAAKDNKSHFDQLLKSMARPGVLTKAQAAQVAQRFVGGRARYSSKAAALEAIRDRRSRDVGLRSKAEVS